MTLFDDELMSHVFDGNIEATELILRIILDENIKVINVKGQDERKNSFVGGRNIVLDVHAVDFYGREIDIEVQTGEKGAIPHRARFHSSMLDVGMLKSGEIAKLIEDFHESDPRAMHFKALADGVKHFKDTEGGNENMSEAVERFARKYAKECEMQTKLDIAKNLIEESGFTLDQVFKVLNIENGKQKSFAAKLRKKINCEIKCNSDNSDAFIMQSDVKSNYR